MSERPILFSGPMVLAIIALKKTQTRRPVKKRRPPEVGDVLWVRETWAEVKSDDPAPVFAYRADDNDPNSIKWRPSIFMPKHACRLWLAVTAVRTERLQDITEADARDEGVTPFPRDPEGDCWTDGTYRTAFEHAWNEMYGWWPNAFASNPEVHVISFRRMW